MATSTLIVEIVVMGILSLTAMLLDFHFCYPIGSSRALAFIQTYRPDNTFCIFLILAASYSIGWAINSLGFIVTKIPFGFIHKWEGFQGNYSIQHAKVMQGASDYSTRFVFEHFSMVRIDRASLMLSLLVLPASFKNHYASVTIWINLALIPVFLYLSCKAYTHYARLCVAVEKAILDRDVLDLLKQHVKDQ